MLLFALISLASFDAALALVRGLLVITFVDWLESILYVVALSHFQRVAVVSFGRKVESAACCCLLRLKRARVLRPALASLFCFLSGASTLRRSNLHRQPAGLRGAFKVRIACPSHGQCVGRLRRSSSQYQRGRRQRFASGVYLQRLQCYFAGSHSFWHCCAHC